MSERACVRAKFVQEVVVRGRAVERPPAGYPYERREGIRACVCVVVANIDRFPSVCVSICFPSIEHDVHNGICKTIYDDDTYHSNT